MSKLQKIRIASVVFLALWLGGPCNAQTPWRFVLPDSFLYQMNFDYNKPATINGIQKTSSQCRWFRTVYWNKDTFLYSGIGSSNNTNINDTSLDFRIVNFNRNKNSYPYITKFNTYPFFHKDCDGNLRLNYSSERIGYYNKVIFNKNLIISDTLNYFYELPNSSWGFLRFDEIARTNQYYYTKNFELHTYQGSELIYINNDRSFSAYKDTVANFGMDCGFLGNTYLSHDGEMLIRTSVGGLSKYGPVNNDEIVGCDFNPKNGQISNRKTFLNVSQVNKHFTSSFVQFSSNDSFIWVVMSQHGSLYGTGMPYPKTYPLIWQFNRYNGSIFKHFTKTIIPPTLRDANVICTFDQGPDGRIYFLWLDAGKNGGNFHIGCISNPNNWGQDVVIYDSLLSIPNNKFPNFTLRSFLEYGINTLGESDEPVWWFEGEQSNYGKCDDSARFSIGLDTAVFARIVFGDGDSMDLGYCEKNRNYISHKYKRGGKYTAILRILSKDCYSHWISRSIPVVIYPPLEHNTPRIDEARSCTEFTLSLNDSFAQPRLVHVLWGTGQDTSFKHNGKLNLAHAISKQDTFVLEYILSDSNHCVWHYQDTIISKFHPPTNDTASVFPLENCAGERLRVFSSGNKSADSIAVRYNTQWVSARVFDTIPLRAVFGQDSIQIHFYNSYGCYRDMILTTKIKIGPEATIAAADSACARSLLSAQLVSIQNVDSVQWHGFDWQPLSQALQKNYTFVDSGLVYLTAFVKNNQGCFDTIAQSIHIQALPKITLTGPQNLVCTQKTYRFKAYSPSAKAFTWYGQGNALSNQAELSHIFRDTGVFIMKCTVSNHDECESHDSIEVLVSAGVNAAFDFSDSAICAGDIWRANAKYSFGSSKWNWNGNEYADSILELSSNTTKGLVGKFTIAHRKMGINACADTTISELIIYPKPQQLIEITTPTCTLDSIVFTNNNNNVQWSIENKFFSGKMVTYTFSNPGEKKILSLAINGNQCVDSVWKSITVHESPKVRIRITGTKYEPQLGYGYTMESEPAGFSSYRWFLNGIEKSNQSQWNQYYNTPDVAQFIRLEVLDSRGCEAKEDTVFQVLGLTKFIFPTAISANSDGVNEAFGIAGPEYVKNYKLWIFNRWGEAVFYTENPNELWIPEKAIPGEYVYKAIVQDIYSRWQEVDGVFMVLK